MKNCQLYKVISNKTYVDSKGVTRNSYLYFLVSGDIYIAIRKAFDKDYDLLKYMVSREISATDFYKAVKNCTEIVVNE